MCEHFSHSVFHLPSSKFRPLNTTQTASNNATSNNTTTTTTGNTKMNSPSDGTSPLSSVSVNDSSLTTIQPPAPPPPPPQLSHQVNPLNTPLTAEDVQALSKLSSCQTNFIDSLYYRNHPLFHHVSPYHHQHPITASPPSGGYFSAVNSFPPPQLTSEALIGSLGGDPLAAYRAKMAIELLREGLVRNMTRQQSPLSADWYRVPLSHITS